jgi:hypothetical protein
MNLQEKMYTAVQEWLSNGASKIDFLANKEYTEAKFNYWLGKWKASQVPDAFGGFREVGFSEIKLGKVLEIEAPSGVKITVFA